MFFGVSFRKSLGFTIHRKGNLEFDSVKAKIIQAMKPPTNGTSPSTVLPLTKEGGQELCCVLHRLYLPSSDGVTDQALSLIEAKEELCWSPLSFLLREWY